MSKNWYEDSRSASRKRATESKERLEQSDVEDQNIEKIAHKHDDLNLSVDVPPSEDEFQEEENEQSKVSTSDEDLTDHNEAYNASNDVDLSNEAGSNSEGQMDEDLDDRDEVILNKRVNKAQLLSDPEVQDMIGQLVKRQVDEELKVKRNRETKRSRKRPRRQYDSSESGGSDNEGMTSQNNRDMIKSPSDTTVYIPALAKANKDRSSDVIDRISNFVEKVRLDTSKRGSRHQSEESSSVYDTSPRCRRERHCSSERRRSRES